MKISEQKRKILTPKVYKSNPKMAKNNEKKQSAGIFAG